MRPPKDPCVLGLGALACLDWPCFAEKVENPYSALYKDLLANLKNSPEYHEMQGQLLSDAPEEVRHIQAAEGLGFAAITFTLKKDIKTSSQDYFAIYPSVVYYVDIATKQIIEIVLGQINEENLEEVQLVFFKHPENNKIIKLDKSVTEQLRAAKQKATGQIMQLAGGGKVICWLVRREGRVNRVCKNICMAACISGCAYARPWLRGPCAVGCNEFCDWACLEGTIGVECTFWDAQFTPMAREGGSTRP
ncbi:MAG: hypothetical protein NZ930_01760 [Candidatus Bipolaricaulota bacterium]|nr:hypothetical protein [Candidatus Bipolaricaulota bacterium]MDW8030200.1 hypothetical protein [Candidatus Bipolaricaulota bacterium]